MKVQYDDPAVWKMIQDGYTKNIFQCESKLVQSWLRRIKPSNIWELSAVISAVRPGCLAGGYVDKLCNAKTGVNEIESLGDERVDQILSTTWGVLLYQESLIALGAKIAWVHLDKLERDIKCDTLRKAVGKKNQSAILEIGKDFKEGAVKNHTDPLLAERLFDIIQDCGRYLFNLSHSCDYAHLAYQTSYRKYYYPLESTATYLSYAQFKNAMKKQPGEELSGKYKEIAEICRESQKRGILIQPPNINRKNMEFSVNYEDQCVHYGLAHIKGFSSADREPLSKIPFIDSLPKFIVLCNTNIYGKNLNKKTIEALILSGSFVDIKIPRRILFHLQSALMELTDKEVNIVVEAADQLETAQQLKDFIMSVVATKCTKRRVDKVKSIGQMIDLNAWDHPAFIEEVETALLGLPMTASAGDLKDDVQFDRCIDLQEECPVGTIKEVAVVIDEIKTMTIKNGKNAGQPMAKIIVHDSSSNLDIPVFSELYAATSDMLRVKAMICLNAVKGKKGWIANGISPLL